MLQLKCWGYFFETVYICQKHYVLDCYGRPGGHRVKLITYQLCTIVCQSEIYTE